MNYEKNMKFNYEKNIMKMNTLIKNFLNFFILNLCYIILCNMIEYVTNAKCYGPLGLFAFNFTYIFYDPVLPQNAKKNE